MNNIFLIGYRHVPLTQLALMPPSLISMTGEHASCMRTPYFRTVWNTVYMTIQLENSRSRRNASWARPSGMSNRSPPWSLEWTYTWSLVELYMSPWNLFSSNEAVLTFPGEIPRKNTICWLNAGLMLAHRLWRWAIIATSIRSTTIRGACVSLICSSQCHVCVFNPGYCNKGGCDERHYMSICGACKVSNIITS